MVVSPAWLSGGTWNSWFTRGRQKGEDSVMIANAKKDKKEGRTYKVNPWVFIGITFVVIILDTSTKALMQIDEVRCLDNWLSVNGRIILAAFLSSLTTVGLAYITAGFTVSQSNKKS